MNPDKHGADIRELKASLSTQRRISAGLLGLAILLAVNNLRLTGREKTILEPPVRTQSVWVQGEKVSASYLEEMGQFIAHVMLDVTPRSIAVNQQTVLGWTHPAFHGELKNRMSLEEERLKRDNATTVFWPNQVVPDPDRMRVALIGELATYINDRKTSDVPQAWLAEFEFKGGRMLLKDWKETSLDDPLKLKPAAVAAAAR